MPDLKTTLLICAVVLWASVQYGLVLWALRDLKRRRSVRGDNKVLWGLVILCLPVAGALIYAAVAPTTPLAAPPRLMAPRLRLQARDEREQPEPGRAALLRDPRFQEHDTGGHPENARRLVAIERELAAAGLLCDRPVVPFAPASDAALSRVHDPRYVAGVRAFAAQGGGHLDADTIVRPNSVEIAALAAGAGIAAVDAALEGVAPRGFVLARPPGHHATPQRGMGFCIFNSIAVAAAHALDRGLKRVLIVDWDVHHGNGTQDAFYEMDQVLFISLHQSPLYPGTGATGERGAGKGQGYTINVPLPAGSGDEVYGAAFDDVVVLAAAAYQPELVLVSAGFDAHAADPLASMRVSEAGFAGMARRAREIADAHAGGRLVAFLEGGYDPSALARSVAATLAVLDDDGGLSGTPTTPCGVNAPHSQGDAQA